MVFEKWFGIGINKLCYLKLILLVKEVYMPSELAHTRHLTTFVSLPRHTSDHEHPQKYFVVDSENEDELVCKKQVKFKESNPSSCVSNRRSSVIIRSRGQSLTNFMSEQLYPQNKAIDLEIKETEKQIICLQKQCKLLQAMINDMAVQQAKILVEARTRERRLTAEKDRKIAMHRKSCPIHSEIDNKLLKMSEKIKKTNQSVLIQQIKPEISLTTPFFSVNFDQGAEIKYRNNPKTAHVTREPLTVKPNNRLIEDKKISNKRKVKKPFTGKSKQNERTSKPKRKV